MIISRKKTLIHILFAIYRKAYIFLFYCDMFSLPSIKRPHYVEIELTNACNLACIHCHRKLMKRNQGFMDLQVFKRLVDEISKYSLCYFRIVGLGEAALHPDISEMMIYLKQKNIRVELTTNGTIFTRFTADEILDWNLDHLGISVDGFDEKSYNEIRENGNYTVLKENVRKFYIRRQELGSKLPFMKIRNVIFPGTNYEDIRTFKTEWLNHSDMITFNVFCPNSDFVEYAKVKPCYDLFFTSHIRWDGRIALCADSFFYGKEQFIGDLNFKSLEQIWKSQRLNYFRMKHKRKDYKNIAFCRLCYNNNASYNHKKQSKLHNESRFLLINFIGKYINLH